MDLKDNGKVGYEYEEGEGIQGLLIFFCIWIMLIDPLHDIMLAVNSLFSLNPIFIAFIFFAVGGGLALFGFLIGILLLAKLRFAITMTMIYIFTKFGFAIVASILLYIYDLSTVRKSELSNSFSILCYHLFYAIVCFVFSYFYIKKSVRIRTTYNLTEK